MPADTGTTANPLDDLTREQLIAEVIEQGALAAALNRDNMRVRQALLRRIRGQHGCVPPCGQTGAECGCENIYRADLGEAVTNG